MATRQERNAAARVPDLLTVEEAAAVLRVGRTKAYAMAREWRATEGRSGLPVLDFGSVLRVPRHALEELVGGPLTDVDHEHDLSSDCELPSAPPPSNVVDLVPASAPDAATHALPRQLTAAARSSRKRRSKRTSDPACQPTLPFPG